MAFPLKSLLNLIIIYSCFLQKTTGLPRTLNIGGLFDGTDSEQELAFQIAVQQILSDPTQFASSANIQGFRYNVSDLDTFEAKNAVCKMLENQVTAIVDTTSSPSSYHVSAICDTFEVPHLQTQYSWHPTSGVFSLKLYPKPEMISTAIVELIAKMEWKDFAVLYEDDEDIIFVDEIFKENQIEYASRKSGESTIKTNLYMQSTMGWRIGLFSIKSLNSYRETFGQIRKAGYMKIVLHVKSENLYEVLKQAQQVGILTDQYSFIITSFDLHAIDLEDFKYSRAKIYYYRLFNDTTSQILSYVWNHYAKEFGMDYLASPTNNITIRTKTALTYDAVKLVYHAIQEAEKMFPVITSRLACSEDVSWPQGTSILNFLTTQPTEGVTGSLVFDENGYRTNVYLYLYEFDEQGFNKIGYWSDINKHGLELEKSQKYYDEKDGSNVRERTLKVVTVFEWGYTMYKSAKKELYGNDKYEGYVIDLLQHLSELQGFKYEIYIYPSKNYGSCNNVTMTCDGMLGEVTSGNASMALVDLTITSDRAEVVDFTHPFINTGISILFKKITTSETDLFGFLAPFSRNVWFMITMTVIGVSFCLHVYGRLSPYEWINPYPCRQDEDIRENDLNIMHAGWFIVAALMQQGSEIAPRTLSTRWLAGVWYFFTLILVSCYTANLAASLAVENPIKPFESAKDLIERTTPEVQRIKFGCKKSGSTMEFFRKSDDKIYQQIYQKMKANEAWLTSDNDEGERRVTESDYDYAFFMESATIDYKLERNCNITRVGGLLDSKGYGIAVKRNSPLLRVLNQGLLYLQEKGILKMLLDRWWKQRRGGGVCSARPATTSVTAFKLANVGGVFIVLGIGCAIALLGAFCELIMKNFNNSDDPASFIAGMKEDLVFAFKIQDSSKPNRKNEMFIRSISEDKSSKISNFSSKWESASGPRSP